MNILTRDEIKNMFPGAEIGEGAVIRAGAEIGEGAVIRAGAVIRENAEIGEGAVIRPNAVIRENAVIRAGAVIREGAEIGEGRTDVYACIVIHGIGTWRRITGYLCDDGLIVSIGCQNNWRGRSPDEMRAEIAKKYNRDHEYFDAIDLVEKYLKSKMLQN